MRLTIALALLAAIALLAAPITARTQTSKPKEKAPAASAAAPKVEAPEIVCPTPLGTGVNTKLVFCDIMTGRDPAQGMIIRLPPHRGPLTLRFDLHNRQTYSEEQVKANRAYARYTATIGALALDNTLISRAVVQSEFRNVNDLVDWIEGGAGPGGMKAVAPTGTESITIEVPEVEDAVSLLGEKLTVERLDGTATYSSPGRPIAVVSNVTIEYRSRPLKAPPKAPRKKR